MGGGWPQLGVRPWPWQAAWLAGGAAWQRLIAVCTLRPAPRPLHGLRPAPWPLPRSPLPTHSFRAVNPTHPHNPSPPWRRRRRGSRAPRRSSPLSGPPGAPPASAPTSWAAPAGAGRCGPPDEGGQQRRQRRATQQVQLPAHHVTGAGRSSMGSGIHPPDTLTSSGLTTHSCCTPSAGTVKLPKMPSLDTLGAASTCSALAVCSGEQRGKRAEGEQQDWAGRRAQQAEAKALVEHPGAAVG